MDFSLNEVIIREKQNFATRLASLVLQAVSENKLRHKALQNFMLCNDSVTVAVEVPVYMDNMDIEHMQEELRFNIPIKLDKVLTGHIDILQLRNGCVHILDYKPQDKDKRRIKPVTQLTLYALMLSRLTGLRLLDDALEDCNKVVVYLEQVRDIFVKGLDERAASEDLIKRYILIRRRIFNLYKA